MKRLPAFISIAVLAFLSLTAVGQTRHALLIGINNYYSAKGVIDSARGLQGTLRDCHMVKGLLLTRVGFKQDEIEELYNNQATYANILTSIYKLLETCRAGDVVFMYYSGHGVSLINSASGKDEGHSQGIVTSDIYSFYPNIIRDNDLKMIFNSFVDKKVTVTFVADCCYSAGLSMMPAFGYKFHGTGNLLLPAEDRIEVADSDYFRHLDGAMAKAIPFTNVDIKDPLKVARPFERQGSGFLQLSASEDNHESYEVVDNAGLVHGLFTMALAEVYKNNPANIPCGSLVNKITEIYARQGINVQQTVIRAGGTRLNGNLLGSSPQNFVDTPLYTCQSVNGREVMFTSDDAEWLLPGNRLTDITDDKHVLVDINRMAGTDTAVATLVGTQLNTVKKGDRFKLVDRHLSTAPLMKVYIPDDPCDSVTFNRMVRKIRKEFKGANYFTSYRLPSLDYFVILNGKKVIYEQPSGKKETSPQFDTAFMQTGGGARSLVFLPIPGFISAALKREINRDQQFSIVESPQNADYILVCNYADGKLVYTLTDNTGLKLDGGMFQFEFYNVEKDNIDFSAKQLAEFAAEVHSYVALPLLRALQNGRNLWLNLDKRR